MRCTVGSCAAARMTTRWPGPNTLGSMSSRSSRTIMTADISSRSLRESCRFGIGVSQMSASSPTWWLACPVSIGPPRGCDMSPTRMPCQPASFFAFMATPLHQRDHVGMRPVTVARQPHHLPGLAVDRQPLGAGDAAMGVEAEHARAFRGGRQIFAGEQFLGAEFWIVGIGERRQRLWIDRALVLRQRRRSVNGKAYQERDQKLAGCHRLALSSKRNMEWPEEATARPQSPDFPQSSCQAQRRVKINPGCARWRPLQPAMATESCRKIAGQGVL